MVHDQVLDVRSLKALHVHLGEHFQNSRWSLTDPRRYPNDGYFRHLWKLGCLGWLSSLLLLHKSPNVTERVNSNNEILLTVTV